MIENDYRSFFIKYKKKEKKMIFSTYHKSGVNFLEDLFFI